MLQARTALTQCVSTHCQLKLQGVSEVKIGSNVFSSSSSSWHYLLTTVFFLKTTLRWEQRDHFHVCISAIVPREWLATKTAAATATTAVLWLSLKIREREGDDDASDYNLSQKNRK